LPGEKPKQLLVIWPDNSWQIIDNFKQKPVIVYDPKQVKAAGDVSEVIKNFISDKKQFDYAPVKAKLLAKVKPFDTPDFNYFSLLPHSYLPHTPAIAVADINNDGIADIYVGGFTGEDKYLLTGNKASGYTKVTVPQFDQFKDYGDEKAIWADVNKDGLPDLIVISTNHPFLEPYKRLQPRLYINKGNFKFEYKALPKLPNQAGNICVFDFNGDGLNDILFTSSISYHDYTANPPSSILINTGGGNFSISNDKAYNNITSIPYITSIASTDIDHDGQPDLLITAEWQPIYIFLNHAKKLEKFSSPVLDNEKGWWQSAMVTDVDGDGKPDLIAGNWGTNNKYNVTADQPVYAYNTDLDKDGKNDLILSYCYKGLYYPFRPKNDLEQELPYLKKEWLSYQKMADKTTAEIFDGKLDDKTRLSANQFNSIFVSDVLHATTYKPLPYLYQQAPVKSVIQGSQAGDFLLNGNFWGVVPYEGKYDALGLVGLRYNKQQGDFSAPEYLVNGAFNFQEFTEVIPVKNPGGKSYIIVTYDGRLMQVDR